MNAAQPFNLKLYGIMRLVPACLFFLAAFEGLCAEVEDRVGYLEAANPGSELPVFDAVTYGAKPDGLTASTKAIQKAIDEASVAGGGLVILQPGTYMTGALFLKSNVELRIDDGVMLRAIPDDAAFPEIPSRSAGIEMMWPAAVINAVGQKNVKLTGKGTLDGNGKFWWLKYWGEDHKSGWVPTYDQRGVGWALSWDCKRPQSILFKDCDNVLVKGLEILRSPFWTVQLTYCSGVTVDGLTIHNNIGGYGPSTDGVDVDSSRNVLIENCDIECNDDNICLKSGRDADGLRVNRPTENVVIRNCITRAGHGMFTLGSETSGGIRHIEVSNIHALGTTTGIRFKGRIPRGGVMEDVQIHDITMDDVKNPIVMELNVVQEYPLPTGIFAADIPDHWKKLIMKVEPAEKGIPEFRNITISRVKASGSEQALAVKANAAKPVHDIQLSDVTIESTKAGSIENARDWKMENVVIKTTDARPIQIKNCQNVVAPQVMTAPAKNAAAALDAIHLDVLQEHIGPLISKGYPGVEDNKGGFETGCVIKENGIFHMLINEMFGKPHIDMRVAHWTSADGTVWKREGTIVESINGRSPINPRAEVWLTGAAFDEVENRWNIFYVTYSGGDGASGEIAGSDYGGKIWRAASVKPGRNGLGGPYLDVDIIMRIDEHSLPWEGQQGVDSFFPWQVGDQWYGFYGSHNHIPKGPWLVGLAQAPSLAGPWHRLPGYSPTPIVKEFIENPVVQEIAPHRWLALYDSNAPNAVGYSFSADGLHWTQEKILVVQSEKNRWSGDNGLWDVRTPLGLLPQDDGTWILIYTAKLKTERYWAVGQCTVRLVDGQTPVEAGK